MQIQNELREVSGVTSASKLFGWFLGQPLVERMSISVGAM